MSREDEIREAVETWRKDAQFGYRNLDRAALMVVEQYDMLVSVRRENERLRAVLEQLRAVLLILRDGYDGWHESGCAGILPQNECDCAVGVIDDALALAEGPTATGVAS